MFSFSFFSGASAVDKSSHDELLLATLQKIGLQNRLNLKIKVSEALTITLQESHVQGNFQCNHCAWDLLRNILLVNSSALNECIPDNLCSTLTPKKGFKRFQRQNQVSKSDSDMISPLDILIAVYRCCDPILQQLLVRKMYLCKFAIPFLFYNTDHSLITVETWPLTTLSLNQDDAESGTPNVLNMDTMVITFARLGRPKFSKSQTLNSLLSCRPVRTTVFFDREYKGGNISKVLGKQVTEIFWLPKQDVGNHFNTNVTFLNIRGSLESYTNGNFLKFIKKMSNSVVVVLDIDFLINNIPLCLEVLEELPSVILILTEDLNSDKFLNTDLDKFEKYTILSVLDESVKTGQNDNISDVSKTRKPVREFVSELKDEFKKLPSDQCESMQKRLEHLQDFKNVSITTESNIEIKTSKTLSLAILHEMKEDAVKSEEGYIKWKECVTPNSHFQTHKIASLLSEMEKPGTVHKSANTWKALQKIRREHCERMSKPLALFVDNMIHNENLRVYIVQGLQCLIETEIKSHLPELKRQKHHAYENPKKNAEKPDHSVIQKLSKQIDNYAFGTEYLFRELGHMCDSAIETNYKGQCLTLPIVNKLAEMVADLILAGMTFEIVDGDSNFMPENWVDITLKKMADKLDNPTIATVSVLGVQGSGKSTFLNAMFGLDMAAGSGKTTKGVHLRLLSLEATKGNLSSFSHLLILDTEGLRSPEQTDRRAFQNHDNQLATFVTALGDITLINSMGENYVEMKDTLEIVIYAFLRLKSTVNTLNIGQTCLFVHQNVTEEHANLSMRDGFERLLQLLDTVTEECAKTEGMDYLKHFNDVIKFDISKNVFTVPNLWQGYPPLQTVSQCYSQKVLEIKKRILEALTSDCKTSFIKLADFGLRVKNIWKGVLSENFVFSFRNSLEIKVYFSIERELDAIYWEIEMYFREKMATELKTHFDKCTDMSSVEKAAVKVKKQIENDLKQKEREVLTLIEKVFGKNEYKDIAESWKETQFRKMRSRIEQFKVKFQKETTALQKKVSLKLKTKITSLERDKVRIKSVALAEKYRSKDLCQSDIDNIFNTDIWNDYENEMLTKYSEAEIEDLEELFKKCLYDFFRKDRELSGKKQLDQMIHFNQSLQVIRESAHCLNIGEFIDAKHCYQTAPKPPDYNSMVNTFLEKADKCIQAANSEDKELQELDIIGLIRGLQEQFDRLKDKLVQENWSVKPFLKVKLYLHVCKFALPTFQKHNKDYRKNHGIEKQLLRFKSILKSEFESAVKGRRNEEKVANQFMEAFKYMVKEKVLSELKTELLRLLKPRLPQLKCELIHNVCKELGEHDVFKDYLSYVSDPKGYASDWFEHKSAYILFDKRNYSEKASELIDLRLEHLMKRINRCKSNFLDTESFCVGDWFTRMTNMTTVLPSDDIDCSFFRLIDKKVSLADIDYFSNCFQNFEPIRCLLINEFDDVTNEDLNGKQILAFVNSHLFEYVWGCQALCPFCYEPCVKQVEHDGKHICKQHRPVCCRGVCFSGSLEAAVTACTYSIQSTITYTCGVIDKKCCCKNETAHKYKDFIQCFPDWDIVPSTSMYDSSLFWMRFVGAYKEQLANYYSYKTTDVPEHWSEISKEEALKSLEKNYF